MRPSLIVPYFPPLTRLVALFIIALQVDVVSSRGSSRLVNDASEVIFRTFAANQTIWKHPVIRHKSDLMLISRPFAVTPSRELIFRIENFLSGEYTLSGANNKAMHLGCWPLQHRFSSAICSTSE
jgi:hypothetical protein